MSLLLLRRNADPDDRWMVGVECRRRKSRHAPSLGRRFDLDRQLLNLKGEFVIGLLAKDSNLPVINQERYL